MSIRNADARRSGLYIGQVDSSHPDSCSRVSTRRSTPRPAYLLFTRAGSIVAQPFDVKRLEFSGDVVPLVRPRVLACACARCEPLFRAGSERGQASRSRTQGVLTYAIAEHPESQFRWMGRTGDTLQVAGEPGPYHDLSIWRRTTRGSCSREAKGLSRISRSLDVARGVTSRLTFGGSSVL